MKRILLLSGPMASGKTSVAVALQEHHGFVPISSSAFLRKQLAARNKPVDRQHLQEIGDDLDKATDFSWLIELVARPVIEAQPHIDSWLLDAVRKPRQVELFRFQFAGLVRHVHIAASESVLQQRYTERGIGDLVQYQAAVLHPNELSARSLDALADQVLDIEAFTPLEIADQILNAWEK